MEYKIVYNDPVKEKVRYSIATYPSKEAAIKAGKNQPHYVGVTPFVKR